MDDASDPGTRPEDSALVERVRRGDVRAFEELAARYRPSLIPYLRRLLGNAADVEDAYQETLTRAWNNIDGFRSSGSLEGWLRRIARNHAIDMLRKRRPTTHLEPVDAAGMASLSPGPERRLLGKELEDRIADFLHTLPREQREVFLLRVHSDLKFREIAEMLDANLNTVLGRMHTALNKLRDHLESEP